MNVIYNIKGENIFVDNLEKNYKRFIKVYDLLKCYDFFFNEVLWNYIIVFNIIWIGLYLNSVN